jgi:rubrerythrin
MMSIRFALEAEKIHAVLYARAKGQVKAGKDLEGGDIHICSVCGHTVIGGAPETCPVCGAARERFKKF